MSNTKQYFDLQGFDPAGQRSLIDWLQHMEDNRPLNETPSNSGFFHTEVPEPTP